MNPDNKNTNNPAHDSAPATSEPTMRKTSEPTQNSTTPANPTAETPLIAQDKITLAVSKPDFNSVFKHWYTWVIIALSFCCIVCIIFTAFVLSRDASNQNKINELSASLEEKEALVVKYAAQLGQLVDDSSHAGYIDGKKTTTKDFIYVGEWGLKFYIPSELTQVAYSYKTDVVEAIDGSAVAQTEMLCAIGAPRSAERTPEYLRLGVEEAPLGCLTKQPNNNLGTDSTAKSVYQDGTSYYIYHAPQGVKSVREEDKEWEETAIKLIQDLLSRNITKF